MVYLLQVSVMEILTKEETIALIKEHTYPGLMGRRAAAEYLGMKLATFDRFVGVNPHLKLKAPGSAPRYCPIKLREYFRNT